jgi:hypothetical protein
MAYKTGHGLISTGYRTARSTIWYMTELWRIPCVKRSGTAVKQSEMHLLDLGQSTQNIRIVNLFLLMNLLFNIET